MNDVKNYIHDTSTMKNNSRTLSYFTFPDTEGFLIDGWTSYSLDCIEQQSFRSASQLLDYLIYSLSIFKVYVIVRVFCFATSMTFKLVSIEWLQKENNKSGLQSRTRFRSILLNYIVDLLLSSYMTDIHRGNQNL